MADEPGEGVPVFVVALMRLLGCAGDTALVGGARLANDLRYGDGISGKGLLALTSPHRVSCGLRLSPVI